MENMRFKVGDRVRIKSLDWYNENKDKYGQVFGLGTACFNRDMSCYCGSVLTIDKAFDKGRYRMKEDYSQWIFTDEMIEGLVEDTITTNEPPFKLSNISLEKEMEWNLPDGYQFVDENGNIINTTKIVLEKKKKEYPKTYEECCKVLGYDDKETYCVCHTYANERLFESLYRLKVCRDAYWKITGETMGLGKPWNPDWKNDEQFKYIIICRRGCIIKDTYTAKDVILAFPTEEMRDAFKENFDPDIEICKELL